MSVSVLDRPQVCVPLSEVKKVVVPIFRPLQEVRDNISTLIVQEGVREIGDAYVSDADPRGMIEVSCAVVEETHHDIERSFGFADGSGDYDADEDSYYM